MDNRCTIEAGGGPGNEHDDESRREVLGKLGRFAYVAPTMLLLVDPANAKDEYKIKKPKHHPGPGF